MPRSAPGPLTALVFRQTLRYGSREGIKVALAPLLTDGALVLLAVLALESLSDLDRVFGLISLGGALFLGWLSWDTWKISELRVELGEDNPGTLVKSVGVNLLNPHPYVFWFTVGGPLVVQAQDDGVVSLMAFLVGFFSCLVGAKMVLAVLIGRYRDGLRGRVYVGTMRTLALLLLGFALWMGWDGVARLI